MLLEDGAADSFCLRVEYHFKIFFEHNHTPSGKKTVTGVQVVTASQVQSISVGGRPFRPAITDH